MLRFMRSFSSDPVQPVLVGNPQEPLQRSPLSQDITHSRYGSFLSLTLIREDTLNMANTLMCCLMLQVSAPQGSLVMHMRPPTSGPFPNPIQRPVMQVNKTVIIRSPPYHNPGRDLPHSTPPSNPEPNVKGPEDGVKVSHPL